MTGLRLEIDLGKIGSNARRLVDQAHDRNISITGVTKAMLGQPEIGRELLAAGVCSLGDSRIENVERMRDAGIDAPIVLLRTPRPSEVHRIVRSGAISANTEMQVLTLLASAAQLSSQVHDVMLMVELGDLREGIMPQLLGETVRHVLGLPSLRLRGIGTNLACRSGIAPTSEIMDELSDLVGSVEVAFGIPIDLVSGGNSANLEWAFGQSETGRINNLRLGESILLGREPLHRQAIAGLHTDAIKLVAEVIESKRKPTKPMSRPSQNSFGETPKMIDRGDIWQTILSAGRQDVDHRDLRPLRPVTTLDASSDHLIVETVEQMTPGDEISFEPGYSALLRAMTSPFVSKRFHRNKEATPVSSPPVANILQTT